MIRVPCEKSPERSPPLYMRDANRQPPDDQPTRPIRRGPGAESLRSARRIAEAKDSLNVPPIVMNDTSRNAALAEDLRLTFLGQGPSTHRSARIFATSIEGLNVPRKVDMSAIEPSDPGLTRDVTVSADGVVPEADVVPCHDVAVDADDWLEAGIVPEDGVGTKNYVSLIKDPPRLGQKESFVSACGPGV